MAVNIEFISVSNICICIKFTSCVVADHLLYIKYKIICQKLYIKLLI